MEAQDVVAVTGDVLSYEHDGMLLLAESIGEIQEDGLQPSDEPGV